MEASQVEASQIEASQVEATQVEASQQESIIGPIHALNNMIHEYAQSFALLHEAMESKLLEVEVCTPV